jgi:GT2 family glycosyltransferase
MDVSILILNYNTRELTINALRSVYQSVTSCRFEVILVDNASKDDSIQHIQNEFSHVKLILNQENVGFAIANNQAMRLAQGRYVLLLNSDTLIQQDTLDMMLQFMDEHPEVGAAGCKLVLQDGTLDKACKRGFPTPSASFYYAFGIAKLFPRVPRFNQYQLGYLDPDKAYPVDCLVGAFMFVRRTAIEQVGLLDEDFFMYGEDIDWCYRIKQAGWVNYYYPKTQILHLKGASSQRKPVKIVYEFHRAMWLFHRKHYEQRCSFIVNGLVYAGIGVKLALALLKNQIKRMR